jgi:hypothetical protein
MPIHTDSATGGGVRIVEGRSVTGNFDQSYRGFVAPVKKQYVRSGAGYIRHKGVRTGWCLDGVRWYTCLYDLEHPLKQLMTLRSSWVSCP